MLSLLLFTPLTQDSTTRGTAQTALSNLLTTQQWWVSSATLMSQCRVEVEQLTPTPVCHLSLSVEKTKERTVDPLICFRKTHTVHNPLHTEGSTAEKVVSNKLPDVHLEHDLTWPPDSTASEPCTRNTSLFPWTLCHPFISQKLAKQPTQLTKPL